MALSDSRAHRPVPTTGRSVTSLFSSLLTYAKDARYGAVENYTTEALAGAIRLSPEPFLAWLSSGAEPLVAPDCTYVLVETQCDEPEGTVDLVLDIEESGTRRRLLFELKVDAGQTGNQLERYSRLAARWRSEGIPCTGPVVLGPTVLDPSYRHFSWHSLRRHLDTAARSDLLWQEFSRFLNDRRLSDLYDDSMTAHEITALGPAHLLLGKMTRVLHDTLTALRAEGGNRKVFADWYPAREQGGSSVREQLAQQFARHCRLATYPRRGSLEPVLMVFLGAWPSDRDSTQTRFGIWIETHPREHVIRNRVLDEARARDLASAGWSLQAMDDWKFMGASVPLASLGDASGVSNDAARTYLIERIAQLEDCGMLGVILENWATRVGRGGSEEEDLSLPVPARDESLT